jgi:hypothetical protein
MVRMAQEIEHIDPRSRLAARWAVGTSAALVPRAESRAARAEYPFTPVLQGSATLLSALGDEASRSILNSAISCGKTVEDISAEHGLPLSTCYRRINQLVGEGLMIVERMVITPSGKRYAVFRTTFSRATINFDYGELSVELTPNEDVVEKVRNKRLSSIYSSYNDGPSGAVVHPRLMSIQAGPFE